MNPYTLILLPDTQLRMILEINSGFNITAPHLFITMYKEPTDVVTATGIMLCCVMDRVGKPKKGTISGLGTMIQNGLIQLYHHQQGEKGEE